MCVCVCVFVCVLHIFCFIVKSYWWPFFFHTPLDSFMLQQPSFPFARCNLQYSVVNEVVSIGAITYVTSLCVRGDYALGQATKEDYPAIDMGWNWLIY